MWALAFNQGKGVTMNRNERRALDKQVAVSKKTIGAHLEFLNSVGNQKYELRKISPLKAKLKRIFRIK